MLDNITKIEDIKDLSINELETLSKEIREFILKSVSKTGGHLASNLGVTDLTVALFKVFDFNQDKIVFDVGHQAYTYKILTGRKEMFDKLRKSNGLSGFPKKEESKYDFFNTGHSSNSISAALGYAVARDLNNENYNVIALIGDGAMSGGEAFEGLNNLGHLSTKMLVILNDNGESISKSVGGFAKKLNNIRINQKYINFKNDLKKKYKSKTIFVLRKVKNRFKNIILPNRMFENLGIKYIGPINGHNMKEMVETLTKIKNIDSPIILHVITEKGHGYEYATKYPDLYHGVGAFNPSELIENNKESYSKYFGKALSELREKDEKIIAITAAMKDGTGLTTFSSLYPKSFFDVGISEEHAVTFAGGIASNGYKPVVAIYSTFLGRAYDQILIDICMQKLPVVFAIDRAGLVGEDGETHQGIFDLSYLTHMPNMEIIAPKCVEDLKPCLKYALNAPNPVAIRYPKGFYSNKEYALECLKKGKWEIIHKGKKIALITVGKAFELGLELKNEFPDIELINATSIKPLDTKLLDKLIENNYEIITIEDNQIIGGFGSLVLLYLNKNNYKKKLHIFGYDDKFIKQGKINELMDENNINYNTLKELILNLKNML